MDYNKEELLQAIKEGVKDAILTMLEAGDGINGPILREPILEAIKFGVDDAFSFCLPSSDRCEEIIYAAIREANKYKD